MNKELLRQLKDAGLEIENPKLSDLISACGVWLMFTNRDGKVGVKRHEDMFYVFGETPEEAVKKLYLEIHGH